jgi:hypothetical protein
MTPLLPAPQLGGNVWIKDEGRLPTGSFRRAASAWPFRWPGSSA